MAENSANLGLNIHRRKSGVLKVNTVNTAPIMLEGITLEDVEPFTYLGSTVDVDKQGGTDADVRVRINNGRAAFILLKKYLDN